VVVEEEKNENQEEEEDQSEDASAYDYLLSMPLWSLTLERVLKLQKEAEQKQKELDVMVATSERVLWERDLDLFSETYAEFVQMEDDKVNMRPVSKGKRAKKPSTVRKQKEKKRK